MGFLVYGYEDVWYQWEVKGYVVFVVIGVGIIEIFDDIVWLLIGFGQQYLVGEFVVYYFVDLFEKSVCFWQVFVVGVFMFKEIGYCV